MSRNYSVACAISVGLLGLTACSDDAHRGYDSHVEQQDIGDLDATDAKGRDAMDSHADGPDAGLADSSDLDSDDRDVWQADGGKLDATGESDGDAKLDVDSQSPDAEVPPDPCAQLTCGVHAVCAQGECRCETGYQDVGAGGCELIRPGTPSAHTQAEVCERYAESAQTAPNFFVPGTSGNDCDPGTLTQAGIDDTLERLNFYRWFVGLSPTVTADKAKYNEQAQLCALMSAWNPAGGGAHHPQPDAKCYTPKGAAGAGSSNIYWGGSYTTGRVVIDVFIDDFGNDRTLGHRRWLLSRGLGRVGVGIYIGGDQYGAASCVKVFGTGGGANSQPPVVDFIAYPPAGYVPKALTRQKLWSFSGLGIGGDIDVTVTELASGTDMPVTVQPLISGYGDPTVAWARDDWEAQAGKRYRVTIVDDTQTVSYIIKPVEC